MQPMVIVAGPRGSGKSCLIASAVVHARRLAALQLPLSGRRNRWTNAAAGASEGQLRRPTVSAYAGADLWSAQECRRLGSSAHLDVLATHLWHGWLARSEASATAAGSFRVVSVALDILGLERTSRTSQEIALVEISAQLFAGFDRPGEDTGSLESRRLRQLMLGADALVLCLPCDESWTEPTVSSVRRMADVWCKTSGGDLVIALTKSERTLTRLALERHSRIDHAVAVSRDLVEEIIGAETARQHLLTSLLTAKAASLLPCSSYGLLRASGTPNLDLVTSGPADCDVPALPLWPSSSLRLSEIVPSMPDTLKHWMPLGVTEAVFGVTPQLAPL